MITHTKDEDIQKALANFISKLLISFKYFLIVSEEHITYASNFSLGICLNHFCMTWENMFIHTNFEAVTFDIYSETLITKPSESIT